MSSTPSNTEEAVELFLELRRRGERVDAREFAKRHESFGPELASALDALQALERVTASTEYAEYVPPERIGAFRIVRTVGRGGMGLVLEAVEEPLGRRVALKILPPELLASASARARFRREAELAARLHHPGIATVYGAGVESDRPWIAMRYVEGETLAHAIARARNDDSTCVHLTRPAPRERDAALALAACMAKVARALQSAHEQGVVHRDVKPSNIIVATDGTPVLLDFGLAITEDADGHQLTRTGETAGTPAYIAPESVRGEIPRPDMQCDVYALGVSLYECLALRRPFEGPTPAALYVAIVSGAVPDVRALNTSVPRDLAVVVATAMERDRSQRYRSAAALADDLEACVAGRPIAARPVPLHGRIARWAKREPRQALLAGLLIVATVSVAALAGTWWASRDEVHAAERVARAQALETALGEGYGLLGDFHFDAADAAFQRALAIDPHCAEAHVGRVIVELDGKDPSRTRARLAAVPPDLPGLDALTALVEHKPLPRMTGALELTSASALEMCVRGLCWQYEAKRLPFSDQPPLNERALAYFTEAVTRSPVARPIYHLQRATAAQQVDDAKAAKSSAAAIENLWPDSPRALLAAGRALCKVDPKASRRILERSIALEPTNIDAYNLIAIACNESGDHDACEMWTRRALKLDPRNARMLFWLGQAMTFLNCADEGRGAYTQALAIDPTLFHAWAQLGSYDFIDGDDSSAIEDYTIALGLDPMNHRFRIFYAAALSRAGFDEEARDNLEFALAGLYPGTPKYWYDVANYLVYMHAFEAGLIVAEYGLEATPGDAKLTRVHATALERLGR